jgi:predicted dehydrogenase/threonine dehydrogenase-like Zn-dependent dehydrogenase
MHQLTQKLKTGHIKIVEAPLPVMENGRLLVRNHYSLISAGTEGSTVKTARKGYIGKARERPEQVRQVLQTLKTQGPVQTYRAVMKKLDSYSPLGYSCAGQITGMASDAKGFAIGDWVACGGLTASHAEFVSVPMNLCVKLESDVDLKSAAYNTLGAIAMQGVRQADLRLGETCAVIGLGLLGQLTGLLLKAAGVRVVGVDVSTSMVEMAAGRCADLAIIRTETGIERRINNFTDGLGCDSVIITAATNDLDPINFAGSICRKRGTIVIVGAVPTGFDREPHFYKKELQVRMSCSYGPGRYDPKYEDKGIDYPPAYVRWTEQRNMQAFQSLLYHKNIDVEYLTTHTFKLENAPNAYDMMMEKSERFVGILIEYDASQKTNLLKSRVQLSSGITRSPAQVNIGFIGAGSYAQGNLLPNISKNQSVSLKGVLTATGTTALSVAERFGFEFATSDAHELLEHPDINTVFIATRHNSHAAYAIKALEMRKNVFVEKPLCLNEQELNDINERIKSFDVSRFSEKNNNNQTATSAAPILMVGFNRRFAPLTQIIKSAFPQGPLAMTYRINAGMIPKDSWIQDPEIGGGRIIGEVCHFVDYLTFLNGSLPISVYAAAMKDPQNLDDVVNVSLVFENGSIGTISYLSNGDKGLPKERIEVFGFGATGILDDFKSVTIYSKGCKKQKKLINQDKGQKVQVHSFVNAIENGSDSPISLGEIYSATLATFKIIESIRTGESIKLI